MNPIAKFTKTLREYITVVEEKSLINQEVERLNHMQREITIKNAIAATGIITIIKIDPKICTRSENFVNQSEFCKGAESVNKFFYNYEEIK